MHTLMIIDDDPDDVQLFSEAISEINPTYGCLTANNGEEALDLLRNLQVKPMMIFLDLNMPAMNGRQCLKQLKKDDSLAEIPVVIFTTSKLQRDAEETEAMGAVYFLTKPTKFEKLKLQITNLLKGRFEEV